MSHEFLLWLLAAVMGGWLGMVFYGGLWWTVVYCVTSPHVGWCFLISWLFRMGIALTGFYWVGVGNGQRLLICLLGFLVVRLLVTRLTRPAVKKTFSPLG